MAFHFANHQFSKKNFLARSFDKTLRARAKNEVIERHLDVENARIRKLEDREQRLCKRDRQHLMKDWRKSLEKKSPEPHEWLSRQKSVIWREHAREKIAKRGKRPGPIVPAHIYGNDGSCHQLYFENGEMRQKTIICKGTESEKPEYVTTLPSIQNIYNRRRVSASVRPTGGETAEAESLEVEDKAITPVRKIRSPSALRYESDEDGVTKRGQSPKSQTTATHVTFKDDSNDQKTVETCDS